MEENLYQEGRWVLRWTVWGCAICCYAFALKAAVLWAYVSPEAKPFWGEFAVGSAVLSVAITLAALRMKRTDASRGSPGDELSGQAPS